MSQDEILSLSRLEYNDDITNLKDYATFFQIRIFQLDSI